MFWGEIISWESTETYFTAYWHLSYTARDITGDLMFGSIFPVWVHHKSYIHHKWTSRIHSVIWCTVLFFKLRCLVLRLTACDKKYPTGLLAAWLFIHHHIRLSCWENKMSWGITSFMSSSPCGWPGNQMDADTSQSSSTACIRHHHESGWPH